MSACNFEAVGNEAAIDLLNKILTCQTQTEAASAIASFLERLAEIRGGKSRKSVAGGASVALVDALMLGVAAMKAEVRAAGDSIEVVDILLDYIFSKCSAEDAHRIAVDLLPQLRPDLFAVNGEGA